MEPKGRKYVQALSELELKDGKSGLSRKLYSDSSFWFYFIPVSFSLLICCLCPWPIDTGTNGAKLQLLCPAETFWPVLHLPVESSTDKETLSFLILMFHLLGNTFLLVCFWTDIVVSVSCQFSSVTLSCPTICKPTNCSKPGFSVPHQHPELAPTHVHWVGDYIQPSHPLSSPSPAFNLSQHQGPFQWVSSSHQVANVLEFQLQRHSFQWILRTDFLKDWPVWSPCSPRDSQESFPTP